MPLLTIVEQYIVAALSMAAVDTMDDGTLVAYVPQIRGVVAFGADRHECARELYALLEEWVQVSLEQGQTVPVLNGIDLSSDAGRILSTYHRSTQTGSGLSAFFADEQELEAAFDREDLVV